MTAKQDRNNSKGLESQKGVRYPHIPATLDLEVIQGLKGNSGLICSVISNMCRFGFRNWIWCGQLGALKPRISREENNVKPMIRDENLDILLKQNGKDVICDFGGKILT